MSDLPPPPHDYPVVKGYIDITHRFDNFNDDNTDSKDEDGSLHRVANTPYPTELRLRFIEGYIPEKYWYWSSDSTIQYYNLTLSDKNNVAKNTKTSLRDMLDERKALDEFFKRSSGNTITFIDLGCGSPSKDKVVLNHIASKMNAGEIKETPVRFMPIDVSQQFITQASDEVYHSCINRGTEPEKHKFGSGILTIEPLIGDFSKLREPGYESAIRSGGWEKGSVLFTFLGNTVGNFKEDFVTTKYVPIMKDNDCLYMDMEPADFYKDKEELLFNKYNNEETKKFVVQPIRLIAYNKLRADELMPYVNVEIRKPRSEVCWRLSKTEKENEMLGKTEPSFGKFAHPDGDWSGIVAGETIADNRESLVVLLYFDPDPSLKEKLEKILSKGRMGRVNIPNRILLSWSTRFSVKELKDEYEGRFQGSIEGKDDYAAFILSVRSGRIKNNYNRPYSDETGSDGKKQNSGDVFNDDPDEPEE